MGGADEGGRRETDQRRDRRRDGHRRHHGRQRRDGRRRNARSSDRADAVPARSSGPAGDGLATVNNLLNLAMLPGVVAHELAHALACKLVGVDVHEVVLFEWSLEQFLANDPFTARVTHAQTRSVWKAAVVGVAPLVVNAAGALAAFAVARAVLLGADAPAAFRDVGHAVDAYGAAFGGAGVLTKAVAVVAGWLGLSFGMTAVPSVNDALISVQAALSTGEADGEEETAAGGAGSGGDDADESPEADGSLVDGPLAVVGFLLENFQAELGVVLTSVLALVALTSPDLAATHWPTYLAVFAVGAFYLLFRRWRRPGGAILSLPTAESQRAERIRHRVEAGEEPHPDSVATLVGQLDHHRRLVRQASLRALRSAAEARPDLVARHEAAILAHLDDEDSTECRRLVLQTLAEIVGEAEDRAAFVRAGLDEVARERETLDVTATKLLAWTAGEDPALVAPHVATLVDALDDVAPGAPKNVAIAVAEVALERPDDVAPHTGDLVQRYDAVNDETLEYLEMSLEEVSKRNKPPAE